ncbi:hypothetical protein AB0I72_06130 [Nocardiopsis sp. NPDC049922]|uniref:hypothetical protein n=1 Tax=Nocardiopsis sp. NPDC049922 TaxID=3155157 RepID=UPI0033D47720
MLPKLRPFLATALAAVSVTTTLSAPPALADASCLSVPTDPVLTSSGSHVQATARSECGALTVLWLVREATATRPRTIQERYLEPGTEQTVSMYCRRSGTHSYQAMVWDPNMMFRRTSDSVTITC